jgi:hypothetical protein
MWTLEKLEKLNGDVSFPLFYRDLTVTLILNQKICGWLILKYLIVVYFIINFASIVGQTLRNIK